MEENKDEEEEHKGGREKEGTRKKGEDAQKLIAICN